MSLQMRQYVESLVTIQNSIAKGDLLDPSITQTDLVALLQRAVDTPANGGLNYKLTLTSIRSDHKDDSCLGPHGHSNGYAVDCWPDDKSQLQAFIQDMATSNKWVTKIGLGGAAQAVARNIDPGNTVIFNDNDSDHVHLQTT